MTSTGSGAVVYFPGFIASNWNDDFDDLDGIDNDNDLEEV